MISKPAIVGCGTVGATLAFGLAKSKKVSDLKIYDFDCVSDSKDNSAYPFLPEEAGIPKVQIVKFNCRYLNPNLRVLAYETKITNTVDSRSFIIDCRDNKSNDINAKIRISLDGHMLYIDSMTYEESEFDYHRYIVPRQPDYIEKAVDIILNYLKNDDYIYKDFRFYDLRNGKIHILKKEGFYGCKTRDTKFQSNGKRI